VPVTRRLVAVENPFNKLLVRLYFWFSFKVKNLVAEDSP